MDLDDFVDQKCCDETKKRMEQFNASHKKIPALKFLEDYSEDELHFLEDLEEIDEFTHKTIYSLDDHNLEDEIEHINMVLEKYSTFLTIFIDFEELSSVLSMLRKLFKNTDFSLFSLKEKEFIASFIRAILEDLVKWKDHVFIKQDAVDVFYINASAFNSIIQLESYIKKNLEGK